MMWLVSGPVWATYRAYNGAAAAAADDEQEKDATRQGGLVLA